MPKIRSLKAGYFTSEDISVGGPDLWPLAAVVKVLGAGLMCCMADDEGRLKASLTDIKAEVFRHDRVTEEQIGEALRVLDRTGVIQLYVVAGRLYAQVSNWERHQFIPVKRRQKSVLPHTDDGQAPYRRHTRAIHAPGADMARVVPPARGGMERKGKDRDKDVQPPVREDVDELCELMARLVSERTQTPTPVTEESRTQARLMLDKDGRSLDQVTRMIEWVHVDPFWRKNVLSMPTLRRQFGRLLLAMGDAPKPRALPADPERSAAYAAWQAQAVTA